MSRSSDHMHGPTRGEVETKLLDLILGRCQRSEAAAWADTFVAGDADVHDPALWRALIALSGADMPSTDREFLHGEADFCVWLETLRRT